MEEEEEDRKEEDTSNSSSSTTTSALDVIVKDVMDDILGKLPLRKLVRLRCVCKAWNNSIPTIAKSIYGPRKIVVAPDTDPYECIKIVDHEAAIAAAELSSTDTDSETDKMIQLPLKAPGKVVGSCNGLLLIEFERRRNRFVLWNPLIKELKILPDLKPSDKRLDFSSMIGFGHDGRSDDYKVVRIFAYQDSSFEVLVYSLKTNSRRYSTLEQPFSNNNIYEFLKCAPSMCTVVNGALYWPVSDFDYSDWLSYDDSDWFDDHLYLRRPSHSLRFRILRFHLAHEKLCWMQAPVDVNKRCNLRLMVFEGNKLCAYQNIVRDYEISMWVLEEDEESESEEDEEWTKLMRIPHSQGRKRPERNFAPLAFMRDGRVLLCKNGTYGIKDCRLYNPKDDPRDNRNGVHIGIEGWYYEQVTYEETIESLVRYNRIQRAQRKRKHIIFRS